MKNVNIYLKLFLLFNSNSIYGPERKESNFMPVGDLGYSQAVEPSTLISFRISF